MSRASCQADELILSWAQKHDHPSRGNPNPEMIEHRVSTLIRVSGPRVYALMGEVRPGASIFGGDAAGARAP
jgi:hypothetical protein